MPTHKIFCAVILLFLFLGLSGCSEQLEFGEVKGTITKNKKPLGGVRVSFCPDPGKDNRGRKSTAITDKSGSYVLKYEGEPATKGAVVGWHRIIVEDIATENRDEDNVTLPRISLHYASVEKTPLREEVKKEPQTFDFDLSK